MKRALILAGTCTLFAADAHAHESRPAYLELQQKNQDAYALLWKVPARGPKMRLGLHVRFPDDCEVVKPPRTSFVGGALIERSTIRRSGGLAGAKVYVDGLSNTLTDVLVRVARLDGSTQVVRLTPTAPAFVVDAAPTFASVATTYLALGMQHIWQGVDHLLFVACLIMIAGSGRRLLVTITGFTFAHSITLALASLDVVRVAVAPVEASIALSIVFLATEIARERRDTLTWRYPITVSASFGLLHGFGFASALGEIGLPQSEIPTALLFFNVGVELGQIAFVGAVLGLVWGVSKLLRGREAQPRQWLQKAEKPLAYTVGGLAMYWTTLRTLSFWS